MPRKTSDKPKKKFDLNRYKTHPGEKGNADNWRKKAERLLGITITTDDQLILLNLKTMPTSIQELKKAYRKAILKEHPDRGGSAEKAARINQAYEDLLKAFQKIS